MAAEGLAPKLAANRQHRKSVQRERVVDYASKGQILAADGQSKENREVDRHNAHEFVCCLDGGTQR
jgi:hypothetical protein